MYTSKMRYSSVSLYLLAATLLSSTALAKGQGGQCAANPYLDPAKDPCNPLRYVPNEAVNIVAAVVYFIVGIALTYNTWRWKGYYMLCLTIGTYCEGIGLALRLGVRQNLHSTGIYIAMYMFVVLSPCAFLAGDYILLGRIVNHLDASKYLFIRPSRVSWTFIISDIITFLIQAAGGGLSTATAPTTALTGSRIFLAGIAAQMGSFILFTCLWIVFMVRTYRQDKKLWETPGWKSLSWALGFTCICFLIRSVYRTVELSQGYIGFLATHERYFLCLDTLPLFLGIIVYIYFWPARYLTPETRVARASEMTNDTEADVEATNATGSLRTQSKNETSSPQSETDDVPMREF